MTPSTDARPDHGADEGSSSNAPVPVTEERVLRVLRDGHIEERGLLPYSSNHSFLALVHGDDLSLPAVYKPQRGESPLWDFEWGSLCLRETAAYVVSHALGWDLVPPTVLREGTRGLGSVQFYVDNDDDQHYFTVQEDARFTAALRRLALFDYVINNADRKSGHCLIGSDRRLWAIDHGICFHAEFKLRTVIWEFSREPIADHDFHDLTGLQQELRSADSELAGELHPLLSDSEYDAMLNRLARLTRTRHYPSPHPHRRNYPWPPI